MREEQKPVTEVLAEKLEQQARWRAQKAEEYPNDERNAKAAVACREAADYVRAHPDNVDTGPLVAIEFSLRALGPDGELLIEMEDFASALNYAGFHKQAAPEELVSDLVAQAQRDVDCAFKYWKVRENRLRRVADRRGFKIEKSRRRDPSAEDFARYRILDKDSNEIIIGGTPLNYSMTLDEVEDFLEERARAAVEPRSFVA